jgi:hypothetical protein
MRIVKTAIISLLSLVLVLLAVRFLFLDKIVNYSLQKTGAEGVSVHISEMTWKQTHIDTFTATYPLLNGDNYTLRFRDVSLHYALSEILASRKISRIDIEELNLHLLKTSNTPDTDFNFPEQIELLKDELRAKIPLENFSINHLQFQGDFPLQLLDKNIQLKSSFADKAIQAEMNMGLAPDIRLSIDMQSPDAKHCSANIVLWKQDIEEARAKILLQPKNLSGTITSQLKQMRDVLLQSGFLADFPESSGSLLLDIDIPLISTQENAFSVKAAISDPVFPGFNASNIQLQLSGRLAGEELLLGEESNFQAEDLHLGKTGFDKLFVDLQGNLSKRDDQFVCELAEQQDLQIKRLVTEKADIVELNVHFNKPIQLLYHGSTLSVTGNGLRFDPMQIKEGKRFYELGELEFQKFELKNSLAGLQLSATYTLPTVLINARKKQLPLKELSGAFQLKENKLTVSVQLVPQKLPSRMQVNLKHNLATASGSVKLKTDRRINLDGEGDSLAGLFTPWPYPFNLDGGKIAFQANGAWNPKGKFKLSAFVSVTGGQGYYKKFLFNGLDVRQDLVVLPELYSKTEGSFALKELIGGIDAHDIKTDVTLLPVESGPLPEVQINNFSASLFDGKVGSKVVNYDLNDPDSSFSVDVEALDLGKLVGLIKMNSLYVTGLISGSIPVIIKGKDISVESGGLSSNDPGGEIRYTPGNTNQAGLTAYALKAVEELQYQSLNVTARYQPSGQLDLDIGLKGVSPGLETRRPVHLNIHAEQNLPALLQSLRFSKGLTEELDKRVKQHYN